MTKRVEEASVCGIFGTGGHGREIAWILRRSGVHVDRTRFVVDEDYLTRRDVDGIPVLSASEFRSSYPAHPMYIGIGDPRARQAVMERFEASGHHSPALISIDALVSPDCRMGEGVVIFPRTTVSVGVTLGNHAHLNANCSISHDVSIGAFSSLSPGVIVCGGVVIGSHVLMGAGSSVVNSRPGKPILIRDGAVVGAGACVVSSIDAGATVAGVPARSLATPELSGK